MLATDLSSIGEQPTVSSLLLPVQSASFQLQPRMNTGFPASIGRMQVGDRQDNRLIGTVTQDSLRGRAGHDWLQGKGGNDNLSGDAGNDRIWGGGGDDRLQGGAGRNFLAGNAGRDRLLGGKDSDQLLGGGNDDWLNGGGGGDRLTGGAGRDRFVLSNSARLNQTTQITDFKPGADVLVVYSALSFADLVMELGTGQQTGNLLIRNQTGDYLAILQNQNQLLRAQDFVGLQAEPDSMNGMAADLTPATTGLDESLSKPPIGLSNGSAAVIPATVAIQPSTVKFSPTDSEATIAATAAARIQLGTQTLYIGTQQVSSINQNPIIASFDAQQPANNWVRTNYEMTGTDGRGYGLFWSGSQLYAVFSVDGTQGTPEQDFRRVSADATQAWLRTYGAGGGAKVTVMARLDPTNGEMTDAVYLSAVLSNGNSNSLVIDELTVNAAGNVVVKAQSYYAPRRPDGKAMTQLSSDGSPFDYELEITPDLKTVVQTSAIGWS